MLNMLLDLCSHDEKNLITQEILFRYYYFWFNEKQTFRDFEEWRWGVSCNISGNVKGHKTKYLGTRKGKCWNLKKTFRGREDEIHEQNG